MAKPHIIIAGDFPPFLRELCLLLSSDFDVAATAECGSSALDAIRRCQPDVAVMDLNMPDLNAFGIAKELGTDRRSPALVICSLEADRDTIAAAREAGVAAFVSKSSFRTDLIPTLNEIVQGQAAA